MTKIILDLLDKIGKPNYCKDGLCTAKASEEKDCLGFTPVHNGIRELTLCLNQNMGRVCEVKK